MAPVLVRALLPAVARRGCDLPRPRTGGAAGGPRAHAVLRRQLALAVATVFVRF